MNAHKIVKTTTKAVTYMGRRASVKTEHFDSKSTGLRRVTVTWIDDATEHNGSYPAGTVTTQVVKGDGWKKRDEFQVIEALSIVSA